MATSTLFGYSVEETDGKLVITVHGKLAEEAIRNLREEMKSGRGLRLAARLSPVRSLWQLLTSPPVNLVAEHVKAKGTTDTPEAGQPLDMEQIFRQGFDQGLDSFEKQMSDFRRSLDDLSNELGASVPGSAKAAASVAAK